MLSLITILLSSVTVFALVHPDSFYDEISWTWSYSAEATQAYNCLGYATGSMTWEWPWGSKCPTSKAVDEYLSEKGYATSGRWPQIISYGWTDDVRHFSKVTGSEWCRAKWGGLERFNHHSFDPYYHNSGYGPQLQIYYK